MRLRHLSQVQQLIKFKARCKRRCILALGLSLYLILCENLRVPWGSVVKNPSATQETQVQPPGQEDPLEKGTATHSNILPWEIP